MALHNIASSAAGSHLLYHAPQPASAPSHLPLQGIGLALEALAELRSRGRQYATCRLVVAGGYDPRLAETVEHLEELKQLAARLGVEEQVRAVVLQGSGKHGCGQLVLPLHRLCGRCWCLGMPWHAADRLCPTACWAQLART